MMRLSTTLALLGMVVAMVVSFSAADAAQCGDDGVCNCEEGFCTVEDTCTCPSGYTKKELPNTGPNGKSVCYACRKVVVSNSNPSLDFDDDDDGDFSDELPVDDFDEDDDDEEEEDIFGNTNNDDDFDEEDDDDDDGDIFSSGSGDVDDDDDDDIVAPPANSRDNVQCGDPGVCDCGDGLCTLEEACICPLGMVRLALPNTGPQGSSVCYACRSSVASGDAIVEEALAIPPALALVLLALLFWFIFSRIKKLQDMDKPKQTRAERLRARKAAKKSGKKKR